MGSLRLVVLVVLFALGSARLHSRLHAHGKALIATHAGATDKERVAQMRHLISERHRQTRHLAAAAEDTFLNDFYAQLTTWTSDEWETVNDWDIGAFQESTDRLGQIWKLDDPKYKSADVTPETKALLTQIRSLWLAVSGHYVMHNYFSGYTCDLSAKITNREMNVLKHHMALTLLSDASAIIDWLSAIEMDMDGSKFWIEINRAIFKYPSGGWWNWKCQSDGQDEVQQNTEKLMMAAFTLIAAPLTTVTAVPVTHEAIEALMLPLHECGYLLGGIEVAIYNDYKDTTARVQKQAEIVGDIAELAFAAVGGEVVEHVGGEILAEAAKKLVNNGAKLSLDGAVDSYKETLYKEAFGRSGDFKKFFFHLIKYDTPIGKWMAPYFQTAYSGIKDTVLYVKL